MLTMQRHTLLGPVQVPTRVQGVARPARGATVVRAAMSQPASPVGPGDMTPSAGATQQLNFEPFQEVKPELVHVSAAPVSESYARLDYHEECEAGVNEQINIELTISYVYLALHSYADRDNVGLPGFAAWFKDESDGERDHAQLLLNFQNKRGGRVKLHTLVAPEMEFANDVKGDALYMMELVLSLEKLNFHKLRLLHDIACKHDDAEMADFIEGQLLSDQSRAVKEVAEYVSQLRRVGQGLGVFEFDKYLAEQAGGEAAAA
jgi:ferritin heavy chain